MALSQTFSAISYNIRFDNPKDGADAWDRRKADVAALLNYYEPALFGIQEGQYQQVQYLDSSLTAYAYIGVGRDDGKAGGEFSAIFYDSTRFSLIRQGTFWLSDTPEQVSVGWDAAMERICTYGVFADRATGKRLLYLNTHYDHVGEQARKESSKLIVEKLQELNPAGLPVLLTGDLNCTPDSPPMQVLTSALDDALTLSSKPLYGPAGTFSGFKLDANLERRIDYVLVSGLAVESYAHLDDRTREGRWVSDHLPVVARVRWP